jgi:hypothetical protein
MIETALVFDKQGRILHWHEPPGRSGGSIPDSRNLWDVLWEHRPIAKGGTGRLGGVAHTHPWDGPSGPSQTDVTTFRACEQGLGDLFVWPVVTFTHVTWLRYNPFIDRYMEVPELFPLEGLEELRQKSR